MQTAARDLRCILSRWCRPWGSSCRTTSKCWCRSSASRAEGVVHSDTTALFALLRELDHSSHSHHQLTSGPFPEVVQDSRCLAHRDLVADHAASHVLRAADPERLSETKLRFGWLARAPRRATGSDIRPVLLGVLARQFERVFLARKS